MALDYVHSLDAIRQLTVDDEAFAAFAFPTTTQSADGKREYPVVPGSVLRLAQRMDYVQRAISIRLHEFDTQVCAVRTCVCLKPMRYGQV